MSSVILLRISILDEALKDKFDWDFMFALGFCSICSFFVSLSCLPFMMGIFLPNYPLISDGAFILKSNALNMGWN